MTDKEVISTYCKKLLKTDKQKKKKKANWIEKFSSKLNSKSQKGKFKCCLYKKMNKLIKDQENAS